MTIDELKRVLAKIQLGDNRQVDALVVREWFDTIGYLPFVESIEAVTLHRRESTAYLLPAHIITNVKRIRADRPEVKQVTTYPDGHPRPDNYAAMVAAAKDPVRFAAEVARYNEQLRAGGFPEVRL
jgi:hypothetical protein